MKNDANIRNFIEISGNMHGKSRKMRGKSGNFRGIHSSKWQNQGRFCGRFRSFPVVFARNSLVIRSFFRSFPVIFRLIPIDSGKHSFSFLFIPSPPQITPILCSKTYSLQILLKFLAFFLAVSGFLLTFANA